MESTTWSPVAETIEISTAPTRLLVHAPSFFEQTLPISYSLYPAGSRSVPCRVYIASVRVVAPVRRARIMAVVRMVGLVLSPPVLMAMADASRRQKENRYLVKV